MTEKKKKEEEERKEGKTKMTKRKKKKKKNRTSFSTFSLRDKDGRPNVAKRDPRLPVIAMRLKSGKKLYLVEASPHSGTIVTGIFNKRNLLRGTRGSYRKAKEKTITDGLPVIPFEALETSALSVP